MYVTLLLCIVYVMNNEQKAEIRIYSKAGSQCHGRIVIMSLPTTTRRPQQGNARWWQEGMVVIMSGGERY